MTNLDNNTIPVIVTPCGCRDEGAAEVAALVADGMGVMAASRLVFAGPREPAEVPGWVRRSFTTRFPWLRIGGAA